MDLNETKSSSPSFVVVVRRRYREKWGKSELAANKSSRRRSKNDASPFKILSASFAILFKWKVKKKVRRDDSKRQKPFSINEKATLAANNQTEDQTSNDADAHFDRRRADERTDEPIK